MSQNSGFFIGPYQQKRKELVKKIRFFGAGKPANSLPASLSSSSTNVPAICLKRWWRTAQGNPTKGYVAHFSKNYQKLLLGNWNVLTLTGIELKSEEEAKNIISILLEFLLSRDVVLESYILMAGGSFSIQVLIQLLPCLHVPLQGSFFFNQFLSETFFLVTFCGCEFV